MAPNRRTPPHRGRPSTGRPSRPPERQRGAEAEERSAEEQRYDDPEIPADVTARQLDPGVRRQLRTLPDKLAERVARHLVAAGRLLEEDPEAAYQHTLAARARAARLAVVREACGEAAYAAGRWAEAHAEFRAVRRMTGSGDYLPALADCERALGRPARALELARDPAVGRLDDAGQAEMLIVAAGARRDLGQPEAAVLALAEPARRARARTPTAARLRYAYADALLVCGHAGEALEWFHRAAASDLDGSTDAVSRAAALEGLQLRDLTDEDGAPTAN